MPKWLEEFLQAVQIFVAIRSGVEGVAQTFGPQSAETQSVVNALTKDPVIPVPVQAKLGNFVTVHLQGLSSAQQKQQLANGKSAPAPAAATP